MVAIEWADLCGIPGEFWGHPGATGKCSVGQALARGPRRFGPRIRLHGGHREALWSTWMTLDRRGHPSATGLRWRGCWCDRLGNLLTVTSSGGHPVGRRHSWYGRG